jgi:hypothetical protein
LLVLAHWCAHCVESFHYLASNALENDSVLIINFCFYI